jgi:hemoglobin
MAERDGWWLCFERALTETVADTALRDTIREPVRKLADHMINQPV